MGDWEHEWERVERHWKAKYAALEADLADAVWALTRTMDDAPFSQEVVAKHRELLVGHIEAKVRAAEEARRLGKGTKALLALATLPAAYDADGGEA